MLERGGKLCNKDTVREATESAPEKVKCGLGRGGGVSLKQQWKHGRAFQGQELTCANIHQKGGVAGSSRCCSGR